MATEDAAPVTEPESRGVDAWLRRYSRWKERRLTHMAEVPFAALAVQNLYLCACILLDGVVLPWAVTLVAGDFSLTLFAVLLLPAFALEGLLYARIRARETRRA